MVRNDKNGPELVRNVQGWPGVDILALAPIFIVEINKDFQRSLEAY